MFDIIARVFLLSETVMEYGSISYVRMAQFLNCHHIKSAQMTCSKTLTYPSKKYVRIQ